MFQFVVVVVLGLIVSAAAAPGYIAGAGPGYLGAAAAHNPLLGGYGGHVPALSLAHAAGPAVATYGHAALTAPALAAPALSLAHAAAYHQPLGFGYKSYGGPAISYAAPVATKIATASYAAAPAIAAHAAHASYASPYAAPAVGFGLGYGLGLGYGHGPALAHPW